MDTHSTLWVPARLAPCIFFFGWIIAGSLGFWKLPFSPNWMLLLFIPILLHLSRPGRRSSLIAGVLTMSFVGVMLVGYLYQMTEPGTLLPTPLAFLGTGLMMLMGMIMGYWFIHPENQVNRPNP